MIRHLAEVRHWRQHLLRSDESLTNGCDGRPLLSLSLLSAKPLLVGLIYCDAFAARSAIETVELFS